MFCSNCGGTNLRKLSLVHEMGLTFVNGTASGVGVGAGRRGIGVGVSTVRSRGAHTTATAMRAAPPAKKRYGWAAFFLIVS